MCSHPLECATIATVRMMVDDAAALATEHTVVDKSGQIVPKPLARQESERVRLHALVEVLWTLTGREGSLFAAIDRACLDAHTRNESVLYPARGPADQEPGPEAVAA